MLKHITNSLFVLAFVTLSTSYNAQVTMGSSASTVNTCSGSFYDSGGSSGNYGANENYTQTICSGTTDYIELDFSSFAFAGGETFTVYDGPTATGSPLFSGTNTAPTSPLTGLSGCITIVFTSNNVTNGSNGVDTGWAATISCTTQPDYTLNGNATYINVGGQDCIQLTAAQNDQTGCAWSGSLIDFNSNFSLSLDYFFGTNAGGADGSTFTFQPNNSGACGNSGAQLGAGGIPNSLIIEFDTYDNDGFSSDDLGCDHIAVEIDGDLPDDPSFLPYNDAPYCGPTCANTGGASIEDGATHEIEIAWDAAAQELTIFFDGISQLTCNGDFVNLAFGGDNLVYWGATAATGGLNNQQYFCPQTVILLPTTIGSIYSKCNEGRSEIVWETESETNMDYYTVEYTYDGQIYHPYTSVKAQGNSSTKQTYSVELTNSSVYYRIKMVDKDGVFTNTDPISILNCESNKDNSILVSVFDNQLSMQSITGNEFEYEVYDTMGKLINSGRSLDGKAQANNLKSHAMYFVKSHELQSSTYQSTKVIID